MGAAVTDLPTLANAVDEFISDHPGESSYDAARSVIEGILEGDFPVGHPLTRCICI